MTSLVTGASGFIGSHLVEFLSARNETVVGFSRRKSGGPSCCSTKAVAGDLLDPKTVAATIAAVRPDRIFHLAAQSLPGESWRDPRETFHANVDGLLNLLDAVRAARIDPLILVACSSSEYGPAEPGRPIREDDPLEPSSPYAASKLAAEHLARLYANQYGMRIVRARPFFLIGPRKTGDVCSDWARRIAAAERTGNGMMRVGSLDGVRDFLDVQDGVRALDCLMGKGRVGEVYNICSGRGCSLREVLDQLKQMARITLVEEVDPSLLRPIDEKVRIGDPSRLRSLGWAPEIGLADSLRRILDYWRAKEKT